MSVPVPPAWVRYTKAGIWGSAVTGLGVLLYVYNTPTDEELIAKFSPEVRANYERNKAIRQREQQELMAIVQQTSASNDPIWKTGKLKSPFERGNKVAGSDLVNVQEFEKQQVAEKKRQEMNQLNQELQETEQFISLSNKRKWYKWW